MKREKYSCYEFSINKCSGHDFCGWEYKIYGTGYLPYYDGVIESAEYFDSENEARFAAVGHIDLSENGPDE